MRWKTPKHNDTRIIERFLLFPKNLRNETRWLERCNILQRFVSISEETGWKTESWAD
jgi:hypothetical protein